MNTDGQRHHHLESCYPPKEARVTAGWFMVFPRLSLALTIISLARLCRWLPNLLGAEKVDGIFYQELWSLPWLVWLSGLSPDL